MNQIAHPGKSILIKPDEAWTCQAKAKKEHGVEYAVRPKPFTARSLVGMTMGARKRAWEMMGYLRSDLRIGERLRPCPGCEECRGYDDGIGVLHCDGSGVMPARRSK